MDYIQLEKIDFDKANWQDIISKCNAKMCYRYSSEFFKKAKEAEEKGDLKNKTIFQILGLVTQKTRIFDRERSENKFGLKHCIEGIDDRYVEILKELIPDILDAEMKARIADVVWIKNKNHICALVAIDSYIESSIVLEDPENWIYCFDRIKRAIGLAARFRRNTDKFNNVVAHIETILNKYNGKDPKFLSIELMRLLQEYKEGDIKKYATLCGEIAQEAENNKNFHKARKSWETKAKWHRLAQKEVEARESLKNMAETYVKEAEHAIGKNPPDYILACIKIEDAMKEFRKIGNEKIRIEELHRLLLENQPKSVSQMKPFRFEIPISEEEINRAKRIVQGKAFNDAISTLSLIVTSPETSKLKEDVKKNAEAAPFNHIFEEKILNEEGKNTGKGRPILVDMSEETGIEDHMFRQAMLYHIYYFLCFIDPIRSQINEDHSSVQIEDLLPIVSDNLLIPEGREYIYASGLHAGLKGDFLKSAHLLIPQLENSIRFILYQKGIIASGFDQDGIQDEYDINRTLRMSEIKEIISEDIIFDLRGLLIERNGSNLRNRMAHGLINYNEYETSLEIKYLWWIILRLCSLNKTVSQHASEIEQEGITGD